VWWWGPFETAVDDVNQHALKISSDIFSRDAQRLDTLVAKPSVPPLVSLRIVSKFVCKPVDFNCEARGLAEEIHYERTDRVLTAELESVWTLSQHSPQPDL
jgi:hypothetical protein